MKKNINHIGGMMQVTIFTSSYGADASASAISDNLGGLGRYKMRNRIAHVRKLRGMTQEVLAEKIEPKTTSVTISRLENGRMALTLEWLNKLAEALDAHIYDLIGDDEQRPPDEKYNFSEEACVYTPNDTHWLANIKLGEHQFLYTIKSNALNAIGVPNGAVAVADFSADAVENARNAPTPSLVLVQFHHNDMDFFQVVTLPRQFVPPHIAIRNSVDMSAEPLPIDGTRADIIAVLVTIIRDL